jgi:hypothetical protein
MTIARQPLGISTLLATMLVVMMSMPPVVLADYSADAMDAQTEPCCSQESCDSEIPSSEDENSTPDGCCPGNCHHCFLPCCGAPVCLISPPSVVAPAIIVPGTSASADDQFDSGYPCKIYHPPNF